MVDLRHFSLGDMTRMGRDLRDLGVNAGNMENVSQQIVNYMQSALIDAETKEPACMMSNLYMSCPNEIEPFHPTPHQNGQALEESWQLMLMATAGLPANDQTNKASLVPPILPMLSAQSVAQYPIWETILTQMGMPVDYLVQKDRRFALELATTSFNLILIPNFKDKPELFQSEARYIFQQVETLFGLGGMLPSGQLFVLLMFSKIAVHDEMIELFQPLALSLKLAFLPYTYQHWQSYSNAIVR